MTQNIDEQIKQIRNDFPILKRRVRGNMPLVYLDNAATTQKPVQVIDAISNYYRNVNANVHRGIHALSEEASEMYENAHQTASDFIGSKFEELVFVKNTTEAINTVAYGIESMINKGDEIVITKMEHHSNLVPYQQLAKRTGAVIKIIDTKDHKNIDLNSAEKQITDKTKLLAFPHMSNVLGSILPARDLINLAHDHGALALVDAAQSVPHMPVDVKNLDCDFMAFSGHKMLAPMGSGGLFGKEELLEKLHPLLFGGDMIRSVNYKDATWNDLPWKFEAGTPNVSGAIGLATAIEYLKNIGMSRVREIEHHLTGYAMKRLAELDFITIYGPDVDSRGGVISFNVTGGEDGTFVHPHDVSSLLDEKGIAIRAGHHCAQPLIEEMQLPATSRMSFYIYNTKDEIDYTIDALIELNRIFN